MVASQLRTNGVNDPAVVAAMASVPREAFLPGSDPTLAYRDTSVPFGNGRAANPPIATGKLLVEAAVRPGERVLLLGAAGGYMAALLARLGAEVVAVESDAALAQHARHALTGIANVTLVEAPMTAGAADKAPFDVLIVDGAVEQLPDALVHQLRQGGRIVTGLLDRGVTRLAAGTRSGDSFGLIDFSDVECVPLAAFARPPAFAF